MSTVIVDVLRPPSGRRTFGGGLSPVRSAALLPDVLGEQADRCRSAIVASADAGSAQR